jgi:hypothetical protein
LRESDNTEIERRPVLFLVVVVDLRDTVVVRLEVGVERAVDLPECVKMSGVTP